MIDNYIFTVTAGRSGQATLHNLLTKYSKGCLSAFEEPNIDKTSFNGFLGRVERNFRRKFFETNELLGRGKILIAYKQSNYNYIESIAKKRISLIEKKAKEQKLNTYFDISKFYARGLHIGFNKMLESFSVVLLVRDPLLNMRSFLNRNKNFFLDNNSPSSENNLLKLNSSDLSKGELYLWAWSEMLLRYKNIITSKKVKKYIVINTNDLLYPKKISKLLKNLNVDHENFNKIEKKNTNRYHDGLSETNISLEDIELLRRFISRIPYEYKNDLQYLYDSFNFYKINKG